MAMIRWGSSECSICRDILWPDEAIVATTHFIGDPGDPLSPYSDSGMHRACYDAWEHRDEFTRRYRDAMGKRARSPGGLEWPDDDRDPPRPGQFHVAGGSRLELRGVPWMRQQGLDPRIVDDLAPLVAGHGVLVARCGDERHVRSGILVLGVHEILAAHFGLPLEAFLEEFAATTTIAPLDMLKPLVDGRQRGISPARLAAVPAQIAPIPGRTHFELVRDTAAAPLWSRLAASSGWLALYMGRPFPRELDILRPGSPVPLSLSHYLPRRYVRPLVSIPVQARSNGMHIGLHQTWWPWVRKHDARILVSIHASEMPPGLRQELPRRLIVAPVEQIVGLITAVLPGIPFAPVATPPPDMPFDPDAVHVELDRSSALFAALRQSKAMALHLSGDPPNVRVGLTAVREAGHAVRNDG